MFNVFSAEDYRDALSNLLPRGPAWPRRALSSTLKNLLWAWGDELARVESRAQALLEEADPRTTTELLADWEFDADLPGACLELGQTIGLRRSALTAKITDAGGYLPQDYIDLAASVGFTITITEYTPSAPGDPAGEPAWDLEWWFVLGINAALETVQFARVGQSAAGDPLAFFGNDLLECVLEDFKQAHIHLLFLYT